MSDDETIGKVVEWLNGLTDLRVIQANQSGPRPQIPYIMVNLTGTAEVRDNEQDVEYSGQDEVFAAPVIEVEYRFSLHAFGATDALSTDLLRPIRSASKLSQVAEPLYPTLVIHETSQIRNVPEWINEDWEPRAQMDMMLRGLTRDGFVIDPIEQHSPALVETV